MGARMILIAEETPDQPEIHRFLRLGDELSASLYPAESNHALDLFALLASNVRFFAARTEGRVIGCGGYARGGNGFGELKRFFVDPQARGQGAGGKLIAAIEQAARVDGITCMQLETGVRNFAALRLYRRFYYRERSPFGNYRSDPLSVFMEKLL